MEYVEGITLKTYIEKKGQLNYKEAISIAIQVARGIEAAHNNKLAATEQYTDEVLKLRTVITYDDQWREYTKITTYYDENGNVTSKIGYYYTYDESGERTTHNGFLDE